MIALVLYIKYIDIDHLGPVHRKLHKRRVLPEVDGDQHGEMRDKGENLVGGSKKDIFPNPDTEKYNMTPISTWGREERRFPDASRE